MTSLRDTARFFRVLADEARLKILWLLFNERELCVCDIVDALEITQSKASRHLATLRHAGLVTDRREGLWSYYRLSPTADRGASVHLRALKTSLARKPDMTRLIERLRKRAVGCR